MAEDLFSSPTPFTPPTEEEDRLAWLRLIRSRRVGIQTFFRLLAEHGSAQAALDALPAIAAAAGVPGYTPCPRAVAESEMAAAEAAGARMICFADPDYPAALASIADPPPLMWAQGNTGLLARPMIAMVGARNASSLGTRMARKLAEGLGVRGITIVSGLARGIDAAAHHAALATGTIGVQAGGVEVPYPAENTALGAEIAARGLRLSERPMGHAPQARDFPRRNRIISGLARALIVVEAAARSGSLITARDALDQGREILAVPGHPLDARAEGCNGLIRDGATLVRNVEDVIAAIDAGAAPPPAARRRAPQAPARSAPTRPPPAPAPARPDAGGLDARILACLGPSPLAEDQLIRDLAIPAADVSPALVALELEGRITRQPGGMLARAD